MNLIPYCFDLGTLMGNVQSPYEFLSNAIWIKLERHQVPGIISVSFRGFS